MKVMGIKFAPLNVPLQRRLETLAAGAWFHVMALGTFAGYLSALIILFFSPYWISVILYLVWAWTVDKDTCERGGRRLEWVRNLSWWYYMKSYFPMNLVKLPGVELDPKKNYLFCSFPHGMLCAGGFLAFSTNAGGFNKFFPSHKPCLLTLNQNFSIPFFRELLYSLGMCSASAESINWLLKYPGGGHAPLLVVGGTAEAFYCRPGQYQLVLKNRKGFIKLAMQNNVEIIPVFSFGETDLFDQVSNPEGSWLRSFQNWVKSKSGIAPIIPVGRGFLQYTFGWVPQRKPVTTVIGKPINVGHIENPTKEVVDAMHEKFVNRLVQFFEEEKHKYLEKPEDTQLIIH